ncbi:HD-domain/PDEase-like protein [Leucogyrophana mollusca]|uniref:HD-domain/PDEase-like protein n=1 Tax=Leucogyrophana mollusca TaxID=85980 RepID=A0ACB8BN85_9AGAM|nr:HD-domain/PDEase-like protein [Leucogyrophana mollusca]
MSLTEITEPGQQTEVDGINDADLRAVRHFKDPIHDYIPFSSYICRYIDTRHFQRLRFIKQLGLTYLVFPGASHNRFEHCLGVAHLARLMAEHLRSAQPKLGITDQHIRCVELAGLCHDLGHGPWSHLWDSLFIPKALEGKVWRHEDASEMLFDDLIETYQIPISSEDAITVKALIAGEKDRCELGKTMPFLFEIVANKRNGLDVDKFDYIARDCHAIGEQGNLSLSRLINSARVINNQICYSIKDANQIYELCYTRFSLHKRIYNHKTTKAIEYMVIDALLAAEPTMKIAENVDKPKRYVFLTDDILSRIESTDDDALEESRAIIERIRTRELYSLVDFKVFSFEFKEPCKAYITPERIVEVARSKSLTGIDHKVATQLTPQHVIVDLSPMHYGMHNKNPLDSVSFYSKHSPDECRHAEAGDVSLLMPSSFAEVLLRIYTKDSRFFGLIQAAYRQVLKSMPEHYASLFSDENRHAPLVEAVTPPPTEAPSTPQTLSRDPSLTVVNTTRAFRRTPSFSDNQFTTVPPDYQNRSPSRSKPKSKRTRDRHEASDVDEPPRKALRRAT